MLKLLCVICCFSAAQQNEGGGGGVCYILDGILVVYGVVLTVLYCRLKVNLHFYNLTSLYTVR